MKNADTWIWVVIGVVALYLAEQARAAASIAPGQPGSPYYGPPAPVSPAPPTPPSPVFFGPMNLPPLSPGDPSNPLADGSLFFPSDAGGGGRDLLPPTMLLNF